MTIMGFKPRNHPQQVAARHGHTDDSIDDRRTIPEVFDPWNHRYRFTLDAAASAENAKCPAFYTLERSGLTHPWFGRVWCNPPFSACGAWVAKANNEMRDALACELVCMLLPANRCEQKWWQMLVEPYRDKPPRSGIRLTSTFLAGRPRFDRPDFIAPDKRDRPPFGLVVLVWDRVALITGEAA